MLQNFILYFKNVFQIQKILGEGLNKHDLLMSGFELANYVLGCLSGGSLEKDSVVQSKYSATDLNDKKKVRLRLRFSKQIIRIAQKYCCFSCDYFDTELLTSFFSKLCYVIIMCESVST